jgi:hypothetical protein
VTRVLFLLLVLLAPWLALPAQPATLAAAALEDGPYVLWKGEEARILQVRQGRLEESIRKGPFALDLPGLAPGPLRLEPKPPLPTSAEFPLPTKVLAVSDVHGNLEPLVNLLKVHGVVDAGMRWTYGSGHLVVVGDVFDRGPKATEILWLLRSLQAQAARAGGWVHPLLGNHEAMVLRGDLRYLHSKYQILLQGTLPMSLPALFGPDSELGRWVRTWSALLKLGPYLFVHGGISPAFIQQGFTLEQANAAMRKGLDDRKADAATEFLMGSQGPLWYRGLVPLRRPFEDLGDAAIDGILQPLGVRAVVIGHTPHTKLQAFHEGRVYAIDAGMLEGLPGEVWICEGGKRFKGLADGTRQPLGQ